MTTKKDKVKNSVVKLDNDWFTKLMCDPKLTNALLAKNKRYEDAFDILYKDVSAHKLAGLLAELAELRREVESKTRMLNEKFERDKRMKIAFKQCKTMRTLRVKLKEANLLF